jgi:hypothetical protein
MTITFRIADRIITESKYYGICEECSAATLMRLVHGRVDQWRMINGNDTYAPGHNMMYTFYLLQIVFQLA